ncbi:MAG: putative periplasmic protein [Actinomycetia bacterium]|nr:putative periplasmic protein [Actinomycetes bacterium]
MAAGHAVLVIFVAFAVGMLLNADTMMRTAENLPLGSSKRSISVSVMRPIKWVSDHLGITEPRTLLDRALGKRQKQVKDPFSAFRNPSATPPTVPHPGTTTKATAPNPPTEFVTRFHPSTQRPLRVYAAGDSLSFEYGLAMGRLAAADPTIEMEGSIDYHVATGLSRPDFFNWPLQLDAQMKARKPDVVVYMVGSNDDQSLASPDGHTYAPYTPGWKYEYSRRAAAVMDQVIHSGRTIIWIGCPIIKNAARSHGYQLINALVRTQADARRDAYFVDPYPMFQDKHGNFEQYLPDAAGHLVKMRADDGIHLERAGGDLLANATAHLLKRIYPPVAK